MKITIRRIALKFQDSQQSYKTWKTATQIVGSKTSDSGVLNLRIDESFKSWKRRIQIFIHGQKNKTKIRDLRVTRRIVNWGHIDNESDLEKGGLLVDVSSIHDSVCYS